MPRLLTFPDPRLGSALAHRQRGIGAVAERLSELAQHVLHACLLDPLARLTIDTGGLRPPVSLHPLPRDQEGRGVAQEVEQVAETRLHSSSLAQRCSLVCHPSTRSCADSTTGSGAGAFTSDLPNGFSRCGPAVRLRHVNGFPALELLRGLRHAPRP